MRRVWREGSGGRACPSGALPKVLRVGSASAGSENVECDACGARVFGGAGAPLRCSPPESCALCVSCGRVGRRGLRRVGREGSGARACRSGAALRSLARGVSCGRVERRRLRRVWGASVRGGCAGCGRLPSRSLARGVCLGRVGRSGCRVLRIRASVCCEDHLFEDESSL